MKVMISCGEPSGDLYAGALVAELRARVPDIEVFGFGGEHLRAAGAELLGDFRGLTVTGLTESLRVVPKSLSMLRRLAAAATTRRPDVIVAVDFPDFNLYLIRWLHRQRIPVVYYISPQLWAWRTSRMRIMQRCVNTVLVIFPFEEPIYEAAGVPVEFVGHPLVDLIPAVQPRHAFLHQRGLLPEAPTVALLPGSRPSEIHHIAPHLVAALPLIRERVPGVQFVVARAPGLSNELFDQWQGSGAIVVEGQTDTVLAASDMVITASGTATVQAALHERPMVVVYQVSEMSYRLGKRFLKVDTFAMPNLIAGQRIVPELIQEDFTPERVAEEAIQLLTDPV
ncbi:MAG: lipid-A-disaccharide synthase, partial [Acidobacteria bacterium]|nr:lipid-A-disaccharide synthase [Acidobacteriota bacterium]